MKSRAPGPVFWSAEAHTELRIQADVVHVLPPGVGIVHPQMQHQVLRQLAHVKILQQERALRAMPKAGHIADLVFLHESERAIEPVRHRVIARRHEDLQLLAGQLRHDRTPRRTGNEHTPRNRTDAAA
ncbi:hypothetical protein FHR53_000146 [Xanthomonas arboricola]|nr:hypothetical protein [Xanthomonas cannabis]NIK19764.1 hypothetical protein [Xanthomonas cannabis]NIK63925.1 hypothetical protein [Xanthomonas cannabis]